MYKKTVLPNGLRIVTHMMKERESIGIGFLVGIGGRHEEGNLKGAAHFLEHILFKGSKEYSCDAIKENIEGVGGSLNAFTAEERTCYYAKIPHTHINNTFDILADMVLYPLISEDDVDKERHVIVEEIKMYKDLPQYYVMELLDEMVWPDHALGRNLAGDPETVLAMSSEDLKGFHSRGYTAKNIVVAACGKVDHDEIVRLAEKKFSTLVSGEINGFVKVVDEDKNPYARFENKEIEQMHLALGMTTFHSEHKDRYALNLMNIILGGNMSSRLFDEVREKRGLAYSIASSFKLFKDTGMFMVRAGVDNKKLVSAVEVIIEELNKINHSGVTVDEFNRAKEYCLGQTLLGMEDTLDHMLWIGESTLKMDKMRTMEDIIRKVKNVKIEDIQRLAQETFCQDKFNLAVVGPSSDGQQDQIKKLMCTSD